MEVESGLATQTVEITENLTTVEVEDNSPGVDISQPNTIVSVEDAGNTVLLPVETTIHVVSEALQGPVGPQGPAGVSGGAFAEYVQSRMLNLLTNGSLLQGTNYNFPSPWAFDPIETHGGGGSIKFTGSGPASQLITELIPVDTTKVYRLAGWAKSGNADGSEYVSTRTQFYFIAPYDADGVMCNPLYWAVYPGSTKTTLAADLKPGDTFMELVDATGWNNAGANYQRVINYWPFTNNKGYTYPSWTYSRNIGSYNYYASTYNGMWAAGGISGNTVTLTAPWPASLGTLPAGTPVVNSSSGGTYKYIAASGVAVPTSWTYYEGFIGGVDVNGVQLTNLFPHGTAYVKVGHLMNYGSGAGNHTVRWSDMTFTEVSHTRVYVSPTTGSGYAGDIVDSAIIMSGTIEPSIYAPNGSLYLRHGATSADASLYVRAGGAWKAVKTV